MAIQLLKLHHFTSLFDEDFTIRDWFNILLSKQRGGGEVFVYTMMKRQ